MGTWGFDDHGARAAEYVYELPQGDGAPSDYYLCDARTGRPRTCALLGGNLRHSCLEWYDPGQCNFCEDRGRSLVCQVRGWGPDQRQWTKVPLHSMDVLGSFE